jgi:cytohesin
MALQRPENEKDADPTVHKSESDNFLTSAMSQLSMSSDLAKRLVMNGFVSDNFDSIDKTEALVWAVERELAELVQELIDHGADVNLPAKDGWISLHLAADSFSHGILHLLHENGADVAISSGTDGRTALHSAAGVGDSQAVEMLISYGSNVDTRTTQGVSPLHLAANNGSVKTIQALLEADAGIQCVDDRGWSPLHVACNGGHDDAVQLLIDRGADVSLRSKENKTPSHIAARAGKYEIV